MADAALALPPPRRPRRLAQLSLIGPLYIYDLVRLARRGRSTLLRTGYALALLVVLFLVYQNEFPRVDLWASGFDRATTSPSRLSEVGERFVLAVLAAQTAAIFVLTPAYVATAISEEKERRTLEMLFSTPLSDREIVLGKLAARLTHLGGVLLAGLPVLALTQLWGGVNALFLLAAFVATTMNLLSVGAISILCSVLAQTTVGALLRAYAAILVVLPLCVGLPVGTPAGLFAFLYRLADLPTGGPPGAAAFQRVALQVAAVAACVFLNGVAFAFAAISAVRSLRSADSLDANAGSFTPGQPIAPMARPAGWGFVDEPRHTGNRIPNLPPIGNWPLLWKELSRGKRNTAAQPSFDQFAATYWPALLGLLAAAVAIVASLRWLAREDRELLEFLTAVGRLAVIGPAGIWCVDIAFRASASVSRERDQQTLGALLTLPVSRATLLGAKWLGAVLYTRGFGYTVALALCIGLFSGALHPLAALLLTAALAAHVAFVASLGLWLSLSSRTTLWAQVTMALFLLIYFGAGFKTLANDADARLLHQDKPPITAQALPWRALIAEVGGNPIGAWWFLGFSWDEYNAALVAGDRRFLARLGVAACGIVGYALTAAAFWAAAWWRFRREQAR